MVSLQVLREWSLPSCGYCGACGAHHPSAVLFTMNFRCKQNIRYIPCVVMLCTVIHTFSVFDRMNTVIHIVSKIKYSHYNYHYYLTHMMVLLPLSYYHMTRFYCILCIIDSETEHIHKKVQEITHQTLKDEKVLAEEESGLTRNVNIFFS